ncbi:MAG TPA: NAD-dependent epimerase/dehydratase family protein [Anaeromyxobacter sp.]|nr:NAD-dependent epimerase/dehydratase family protein [Anaeromyxobacter sp.]
MTTGWVAGASGLVGGVLLRALLADDGFERVVSVGRRVLPVTHAKLSQVLLDLTERGDLGELPAPEVAFSCLGTTMRKAGTQEAFRAVDLSAVLSFARSAHARGASTFVHVSAMGADPRARVFYNRVKGEVEEAVAGVGFKAVYALRPSILDGPREENRPLERGALVLLRTLAPVLGRWRPTRADAVAAAMIELARSPEPGAHVVEAEAISRMPPLRG